MNEQQAINEFIKDNFAFLTSGNFERTRFKNIVRDHFIKKHNKKFGIPKIGEVCEWIVRYQISAKIPSATIKEQLDLFPLYKDIGAPKKRQLESLIGESFESGLDESELKALSRANAYDSVAKSQSDQLKIVIEEEHKELIARTKNLEEQLEKKKQENELLPSVLDEGPVEEPDFEPSSEDHRAWWEIFYLKENPFPGQDGLSKIKEDNYESVVVKTQSYLSFIGVAEKDFSSIFNTAFMLIGNYGYGKTTFQDYLAYYLIQKNILTIRITCFRSHPDCNGYLDSFTGKLVKELQRYTAPSTSMSSQYEREDIILDLCTEITRKYDGIFIMLDDFHKHETEVKPIYDFLGNLQLYQDQLARQDCNVGFMVSALPSWERDLPTHQQMSGFFSSSPIKMMSPSPDFIHQVVNKRIAAYCYDSSPREIDLEFIKKIFDKNGPNGNYRDYLNRIIDELNDNNTSILSSPLSIDDSTLAELELIFRKTSTVNEPLQKLLKASGFKKYSKEQVNKCLELLVTTSNQNGVFESDKLFKENTFYFSRLKELKLISKLKLQNNTSEFKWVISKGISRVVEEIEMRYGYTVSDYFLKLFAGKKYTENVVRQTVENPELTEFKLLVNENRSKLNPAELENIDRGVSLYDRFAIRSATPNHATETLSIILASIELVSMAQFAIDGSELYFKRNNIQNTSEKWHLHYFDHESYVDLHRKHAEYSRSASTADYGLCVSQGKDCFRRIVAHLAKTIRHSVLDEVSTFKYLNSQTMHTPEDSALYSFIDAETYTANRTTQFNYIERLTDHIENRLRQYLYTTSILVFGLEKYSQQIASDDRKYAHRNIKDEGIYTTAQNLFYGFTRAQFKQLFMQGGSIKNLIISKLSLNWTEDNKRMFFELYVDENIKTSHKKFYSYSQEQRMRYINYSTLALELINSINDQISGLILNNAYQLVGDDSNNIEGYNFRFGFTLKQKAEEGPVYEIGKNEPIFVKDDLHYRHTIKSEIHLRIRTLLESKFSDDSKYIVDLSDYDFICENFSTNYQEFVCTLVHLANVEKFISLKKWFGSQIMIHKL